MKTLALMLVLVFPLRSHEPLAQRIAHTDPAKYTASKAVHCGAGQLDVMVLLDAHSLDTNLFFLHRGILEPKSGLSWSDSRFKPSHHVVVPGCRPGGEF